MILPPVDPNLEHQLSDKPPLRDDTGFAAGKIAVFQYAAVVLFLFLISGFWTLQVQNEKVYDARAQHNSIKSVPILAPRGRILDRDGRVIVDNHASYTLLLAREQLKEEHLRPIAQGLDMDWSDLDARVRRFRNQPKYVPLVVKQELTPADLAFVESHRDFFPELVTIQSQRRLYPQNGMMAHVVGYTGEVSEPELDLPEFAKHDPGDIVGKFGLEREYNDWLTGVDGERQQVVDNRGQVRQVLAQKPYTAGKDLTLTIDLDLQVVAELAMDTGLQELNSTYKNGAVVALDPRSGEVLAMVSRPTFDLNRFAGGIKPRYWREISENPDHPLMNKAIQAVQAPGLTFKPFTALAGLESGAIDNKWGVNCPGGATLYGHYFKCHERHGGVTLHRAIVRSCDTYFYNVGVKAGIDNLAFYGDIVGFGHPTGVDLPHEVTGTMPSEKWKLRTQRQKWYAGETPSVAIGQGAVTVTPIGLARAIAGLAIGGTWYRPHLTKEKGLYKETEPVKWTLNPQNVQDIIDGMWGVVNEDGTGGRARLAGLDVCGKTGTAQLASNEFLKSTAAGRAKNMKDNSWFEGFAPRSAPEIVVVAFFEHGEHGHFAGPIVRDVIKAYFDKKARLAALKQQKQALQDRAVLGIPSGGLGAGGSGLGVPSAPAATKSVEVAYFEGNSSGQRAEGRSAGASPQPPAPSPQPPR